MTPLCPKLNNGTKSGSVQTNLCFKEYRRNLLPTMTMKLKKSKRQRKVTCLIDCDSQRSFITKEAAQDLCPNYNELYSFEQVHTYIGKQSKMLKQMSTGIKLKDRLVFVPLLVDENMNMNYKIPGMNTVINKLKSQKVSLIDSSFYLNKDHENIELDMLVGIDIIQYFSFSINKMGGGFNFIIDNKVAPVGNISNFLSSAERKDLFDSQLKSVEQNNTSKKTKAIVNLIMDPLRSNFNPLEHILFDSEVDNGQENLFSFESMGKK